MCSYLGYGAFSLVVTLMLCAFIADRTAWHPYWTWLAALNATTFLSFPEFCFSARPACQETGRLLHSSGGTKA